MLEACLRDETNLTLGIRDAAIISLMYSSGCAVRKSSRWTWRTRTWERFPAGDRKRNKERIAFLAAGARLALEKRLERRGKLPGPLFYAVNKGGNIVRTRKQRLNTRQKQAGERPKRITARLSDQTIYHLFEKRAWKPVCSKKPPPRHAPDLRQ